MGITIEPITRDDLDEMILKESRDRATYSLTADDISSLERYAKNRIKPGSFMTAVFENNLKEACFCADTNNRRKIFEYVQWLYEYAPSACWGSLEKVTAWLSFKESESND